MKTHRKILLDCKKRGFTFGFSHDRKNVYCTKLSPPQIRGRYVGVDFVKRNGKYYYEKLLFHPKRDSEHNMLPENVINFLCEYTEIAVTCAIVAKLQHQFGSGNRNVFFKIFNSELPADELNVTVESFEAMMKFYNSTEGVR